MAGMLLESTYQSTAKSEGETFLDSHYLDGCNHRESMEREYGHLAFVEYDWLSEVIDRIYW